jgi:hypothetical protein
MTHGAFSRQGNKVVVQKNRMQTIRPDHRHIVTSDANKRSVKLLG